MVAVMVVVLSLSMNTHIHDRYLSSTISNYTAVVGVVTNDTAVVGVVTNDTAMVGIITNLL